MPQSCHCHEIPGLGHCNWVIALVALSAFMILPWLLRRCR